MAYSRPKGTFDVLPEAVAAEGEWNTSENWQHLESVIKDIARDFNYLEMRTPIFEQADLFIRAAGETSDIISKEMYVFKDKGDRTMSLRPEGTASVMRSFLENGLQQHGSPQKYFYLGPFFRYDRPQAGRYRQFHQFSVEAVGIKDPMQDFEVVHLLHLLYSRLGIGNLNVLINSIGSGESRGRYIEALKAFLMPSKSELSEISQVRLEKNPLRILDTKNPKERALLENAPSIIEFLSDEEKRHFESICNLLTKAGISYTIDDGLVRGLDYYSGFVFEMTSDVLGAQSTVGAGGRYDGLLSAIGGPDLPAIGFSTGMERILQTMQGQNLLNAKRPGVAAFVIPLGEKAKEFASELTFKLRNQGISSDILLRDVKLSKALQMADGRSARYALIIGDEELASGQIQLKNLQKRTSENCSVEQVLSKLGEE